MKRVILGAATIALLAGCSNRPPINYQQECRTALYNAKIYIGAIADIKEMGLEPTYRLKQKENDALYGIVKYCNLKGQYLKNINYHIAVSDKGLGL